MAQTEGVSDFVGHERAESLIDHLDAFFFESLFAFGDGFLFFSLGLVGFGASLRFFFSGSLRFSGGLAFFLEFVDEILDFR